MVHSIIGKRNRRDVESDRRIQDRHRARGGEIQARANRSREDHEKMLRNLQSAPDEESRALGKFIQRYLKQN